MIVEGELRNDLNFGCDDEQPGGTSSPTNPDAPPKPCPIPEPDQETLKNTVIDSITLSSKLLHPKIKSSLLTPSETSNTAQIKNRAAKFLFDPQPLLINIDISAPSKKTKNLPRVPIDLICLIDKSGSMLADNKLTQVKSTLKSLLTQLSPQDRLSLIEFGSKGKRLTPMSFCSKANNDSLFAKAIDGLEAEGGTSIEDGLLVALKVQKARKFQNKVSTILLLSDGEDPKLTQGGLGNLFSVYDVFAKGRVEFGFNVNCFGYGEDCNEDQLKMISDFDGKQGKFYYVGDGVEVEDAFTGCLGEINCILANESVLDLRFNPSGIFPEISIKKVFCNTWRGESEIKRKIILGHLVSESKLNYVVHFNYGTLAKNFEELLDCMEFEGKTKILLGEVELSGLNVFCQTPLSKKTDIWLEIEFPKAQPVLPVLPVGQPEFAKAPKDEAQEINGMPDFGTDSESFLEIMEIDKTISMHTESEASNNLITFGAGRKKLPTTIEDAEADMIEEFQLVTIDDEVLQHNARVTAADNLLEVRDCIEKQDYGKSKEVLEGSMAYVQKAALQVKAGKANNARNMDMLYGVEQMLNEAMAENDECCKKRDAMGLANDRGDRMEMRKQKNALGIQTNQARKKMLSQNCCTIGQYYAPQSHFNNVYSKKQGGMLEQTGWVAEVYSISDY